MIVVSGAFLAGILTTMVFVDVTKLMVGRLRPVFLEVCDVNLTLCYTKDQSCDADDVCMQSDHGMLRWARYVLVRAKYSLSAFFKPDNLFRTCARHTYQKQVPVYGASDIQFDTDFFLVTY